MTRTELDFDGRNALELTDELATSNRIRIGRARKPDFSGYEIARGAAGLLFGGGGRRIRAF
jgi:hypothetical protein